MGFFDFFSGNTSIDTKAGDDMYKAFVDGQNLTHAVIRRAVHNLADGQQLSVNNATEDEKAGWLLFVTLTFEFIKTHHEQKDQVIFPLARKAAYNPSLLVAQQAEHKQFDGAMAWWYKSMKNGFVAPEQLTDAMVAQTKQVFQNLQKTFATTLAAEEALLTAEFWRFSKNVTEADLVRCNTECHRVMNNHMKKKGASIVFTLMNITKEEQKYYEARVPYPVRKWFFPSYASSVAKAIPFCAYPRFGGRWLPATHESHKRFAVNGEPKWDGNIHPSWFNTHHAPVVSALSSVLGPQFVSMPIASAQGGSVMLPVMYNSFGTIQQPVTVKAT
jgi:hypothetical protein